MKMLTTEELRAAAHRKVDEADEETLVCMLEAGAIISSGSPSPYSPSDIVELHEAAAAYKRGESSSTSEKDFWKRVSEKTGFERREE